MSRFAKVIRILTIPPVLAFALVTTLFLFDAALLGGAMQYGALVFTLAVLPALAYPIQPLLPMFRDKGREGQRNLAFIASIAGYLCGIVFAFATAAPITVHIIYWTYFVSVLMLSVFNKATRWKASGHACGVAGPISMMIYVIGVKALPVTLVFALMAWASVRIRRHTPTELILGGMDSVAAFFLVLLVVRYFT